jgi:hypothetical protein
MFVRCDVCGYDSGDRDSNTELAAKVNADGGHMMMAYDEHGKPKGWDVACPNGHGEDDVRMD